MSFRSDVLFAGFWFGFLSLKLSKPFPPSVVGDLGGGGNSCRPSHCILGQPALLSL